MDTWLWENRQQYRILVSLTQLLLDRGFSPMPTEPYSDNAFRTDHTEAMVGLLRSFSLERMEWPLRLFSTGPLFRPGRAWSDAVDVEWIGLIGADEERDMIRLVAEMAAWLADEGISADDLTMVFGHVGWLTALGRELSLSDGEIRRLIAALRQGRITVVEDMIGGVRRDAFGLFAPQEPGTFFTQIREFLDVKPTHTHNDRWHSRWDLSLTGQRDYYTGLVFSLYHSRSGLPLVNGGQFAISGGGEPSQGIGFTLYLDACREAIGEMHRVI